MSSNKGTLKENTVFNWFSRYEDTQGFDQASKHFPVQTNTHPAASSLKDHNVESSSEALGLVYLRLNA